MKLTIVIVAVIITAYTLGYLATSKHYEKVIQKLEQTFMMSIER